MQDNALDGLVFSQGIRITIVVVVVVLLAFLPLLLIETGGRVKFGAKSEPIRSRSNGMRSFFAKAH